MKRFINISLILALLLSASCNKFNPFDAYWHGGFEREDTGGKPGKGGLFADGFGTEESPYGLSTPQHMQNISRGLVAGEMVYFKMLNDIDLSGIEWTALNPISPYNKFIDFDGDGHVITNLLVRKQSYGSFFGVLCGSCHDVGFLNAFAESTNSGGIIGGYVGLASPTDDSFTGRVERVYVTGEVAAGATANGGGICGDLGKMVDMTPCLISDCYSIVEVTGGNVGGLAGNVRNGSRIENSYASGSVDGNVASDKTYYAGGIAATVNGGSIVKSIAWNSSVSGGVVGSVYGNNSGGVIENCYALSSIAFSGQMATQDNVSDKDPASLQSVAGGWEGGWHSDGKVSNGYPILSWQYKRGDYADFSGHGGDAGTYEPGFKSGSGTETDPYIIENLSHLRSMHDLLEPGKEYWLKLAGDIDAKALSGWEPINITDPYNIKIHFDGDNHTITNLKFAGGQYAGFFGVLNGECRNLTLVKCTLSQGSNSACGLLGGWAGANNGAKAVVSNIRVSGGSGVNSSGSQPSGGLFGCAANATFTDCEVEASINVTNKSTSASGQGCGGLVGKATAGCTFTRCSFSGELKGNRLIGGIVGYAQSNVHFTSCSNSAAISASGTKNGSTTIKGERAAGIAGHADDGGVFAGCVNSGAISGENCVGGIVGYTEKKGSVSRCSNTGNVSALTSDIAGGIAGCMVSGKISDCYSRNCVISVSSKGQRAGGIVAEIYGRISDGADGVSSIENCWSSAAVSGGRHLGGIAGRLSANSWTSPAETDKSKTSNITVSGCIAWNQAITTAQTGKTKEETASSGAIVGYTYVKNTHKDCWRKKDLNYKPSYPECGLVDQENSSPDSPLTVGVEATYCYPYHGKEAAAGATVSSLAGALGWSTEIWNLSGNEPVLK